MYVVHPMLVLILKHAMRACACVCTGVHVQMPARMRVHVQIRMYLHMCAMSFKGWIKMMKLVARHLSLGDSGEETISSWPWGRLGIWLQAITVCAMQSI